MSHLEPGTSGGMMGGLDYEAHWSQTTPMYHESYHEPTDEYRKSANDSARGGQNVGQMERALSVAAGLGLAAFGLKRGRLTGLVLTALGGGLVWRGLSGRCQCYAALGINTAEHNPATAVPAQQGFKLQRTLVVHRAPQDLYDFWRRLENLPQVMRHLKYVETSDDTHSHWKAEGAFGADVEWDAEIINDRQNELIAWKSLPGGDVDTAGSVCFRPVDHGEVTEITLSMKYNPPAGKLGAQLAEIFGDGLEQKLDEDLNRFKDVMETGMEAAPATTTSARNQGSSQSTQYT